MGRIEVWDLADGNTAALGWHMLWKCMAVTLFRLQITGLDCKYVWQNNMNGWHNQRLRGAGANWHIMFLSILYKSSQISLLQDQPAD